MDEFSFWIDSHCAGKEVYIPDLFKLDKDNGVRQVLEPQGIISSLAIPLLNHQTCFGFLGLDAVAKQRKFSDQERDVLMKFGEAFLKQYQQFEAFLRF